MTDLDEAKELLMTLTKQGMSAGTHQPPPRGHAPSYGLYPARFWGTRGCREADTWQGNVGDKAVVFGRRSLDCLHR